MGNSGRRGSDAGYERGNQVKWVRGTREVSVSKRGESGELMVGRGLERSVGEKRKCGEWK